MVKVEPFMGVRAKMKEDNCVCRPCGCTFYSPYALSYEKGSMLEEGLCSKECGGEEEIKEIEEEFGAVIREKCPKKVVLE